MFDEVPSGAVALARMRAAARVLRDAGLEVELEVDADGGAECVAAHLRRAVRWHRYSKGALRNSECIDEGVQGAAVQ